ncbi:MAG: hypothetical protein ACLTXP_10285 [Odoribacter splanchnicus]
MGQLLNNNMLCLSLFRRINSYISKSIACVLVRAPFPITRISSCYQYISFYRLYTGGPGVAGRDRRFEFGKIENQRMITDSSRIALAMRPIKPHC